MKTYFVIAALLIFAACSPATKITRSWSSPEKSNYGYNNLFVAVVLSDISKRQVIENDIQSKLNKLGINSTTSNSTIQPNFWMSTDLDKNAMINVVKRSQKDAIMTVSLIDVQNEQRYIPGTMMAGPMVGPGAWGMGANFGGFWGWNHGMMMTPGHVVNDRKYFIEINVYDTASELMIWSAQSKTLNPRSLEKFSSEFAEIVIERMLKEGVLGV
ncbi:hypothetical protein [Cecembia calidifontis]|uniref:DUF4136 domain-containing protein n=1 Tax=Cecembia calidifontis TaxID=1187080 RepID=A0A4Q7P6E6_9BACT|nr:hypothetical protein [Cecembia calidifontis]RZS95545.1 hypothetical protein BC751_1078 [Cecembia calidifontis]